MIGGNLQHREVGVRIGADDLRLQVATVLQGHRDVVRAARHMVVGEHIALLGIHDHARAQALRHALARHALAAEQLPEQRIVEVRIAGAHACLGGDVHHRRRHLRQHRREGGQRFAVDGRRQRGESGRCQRQGKGRAEQRTKRMPMKARGHGNAPWQVCSGHVDRRFRPRERASVSRRASGVSDTLHRHLPGVRFASTATTTSCVSFIELHQGMVLRVERFPLQAIVGKRFSVDGMDGSQDGRRRSRGEASMDAPTMR